MGPEETLTGEQRIRVAQALVDSEPVAGQGPRRLPRRMLSAVGGFLLIAGLAVGLWIQVRPSVEHARRRQQARQYAPEVVRQMALCAAVASIYEYSGRLVRTRLELQQTAYYPFREDYGAAWHGGTLELAVWQPDPATWSCRGVYRRALERGPDASLPFDAAGPAERTARRLAICTGGAYSHLGKIHAIRASFLARHAGAERLHLERRGVHPTSFKLKPVPAPPGGRDLPRSAGELVQYLAWLRATEGLSRLEDGWGREVRGSIVGDRLVVRSAGADGIRGTPDDMARSTWIR